MSSLLFDTVLQMALKDDVPRWQKKRGMSICLGGHDHDCLTNFRFADDVFLFASSKEQLQKCCAISSIAQKRLDSKYFQEIRKFSATKARTEEKKSRLTTSKPKYYQKKKVQNVLARRSHSSNRRRPRSRIALELLGRRSTNTKKS